MSMIRLSEFFIVIILLWETRASQSPNVLTATSFNNPKAENNIIDDNEVIYVDNITETPTESSVVHVGNDENIPTGIHLPITVNGELPPPQHIWGGLYPYETPTRDQKSLDGIWNFRLSPKNDSEKGFREEWFSAQLSTMGPVIAIPVPSSYNDISQQKEIREHIGWAW